MLEKIFLAAICFILITGCEHTPISDTKENREEYAIKFKIKQQIEMQPFSPTKGIPGNLPQEPETSSSSNGTDDNPELSDSPFKYIEYGVYDIDTDELIRHISFSDEDEENDDFGVYLYDSFKAGIYKVCFLAHTSKGLSLTNNKFTFNQINDTFYASEEIEIDTNSSENPIDIVLKRTVSRVEFLATDPVPDKVKSFVINVSNRYNVFDFFLGKPTNTSSTHNYNHEFTLEEKAIDKRNKHAFFTFVPDEASNSIPIITLTSFDQDNEEVRKRIIQDIPIYQNKITRYTGILYTRGLQDGTFGFVIENDGAWSETNEFILPD